MFNAVPFVGRKEPLEQLQALLGEAINGHGQVLFVSGEAGSGKSRFAQEGGRMASLTGFTCLEGRCASEAARPFLPFIEVADSLIVSGLAPPSCRSNPLTCQGPAGEASKALLGLLDLLQEASRKAPLYIRLEDLHWADTATLQLLHLVARNLSDTRILLVATYRSEEVDPTEDGEEKPLWDSLRVLRREGLCEDIGIAPFSSEDLHVLFSDMLGGPVDDALVQRMEADTGGNPLFAVESLRFLYQSQNLVKGIGGWDIQDASVTAVPVSIREALMSRIERMRSTERRVLEYASVFGEDFDPEPLAQAMGLASGVVSEMLERIEKEALITFAGEDRYRFEHELVRRFLYESIGEAGRASMHLTIGRAIEAQNGGDKDHGALSMHYCAAGGAEKCLRYSLLAGRCCINQGAAREALPFFQRAMQKAEELGAKEAMMDAVEGMADARRELGSYTVALENYQRLLGLGVEGDRRASVTQRMASLFGPMRLGMGATNKANELLAMAEAYPGISEKSKADILAQRVRLALWDGNFDAAEEFCQRAEGLYAALGLAEQKAGVLTDHCSVHLSRGEVEKAFQAAKEAKAIYETTGSTLGKLDIALNLGIAYWHTGEMEKARATLQEGIRIGHKFGDHSYMAWCYLYQALIQESTEHYVEAQVEAMKSLEQAAFVESPFLLAGAKIVATHSRLIIARDEETERSAEECLQMLSHFPSEARTPGCGLVNLLNAELLSSKGSYEEANQRYLRSIDLFTGSEFGVLFKAMAFTYYAKSLAKQGRMREGISFLDQAMELYERLHNQDQMKRTGALKAYLERLDAPVGTPRA